MKPNETDVQQLAQVMTDADCASREYPFSDESRARAVLSSDWLRTHLAAALAAAAGGREAEAWDEGYSCGLRDDIAVETPIPNPYRTGGSDD